MAEAGERGNVEADPGRQRKAYVLTGVEAHHALVRRVRQDARPEGEAAIAPGGNHGPGHGVAGMERLAGVLGGQGQADEGVATVMSELGARADHAATGLHHHLVRSEAAEVNADLLELDLAGPREHDANRRALVGFRQGAAHPLAPNWRFSGLTGPHYRDQHSQGENGGDHQQAIPEELVERHAGGNVRPAAKTEHQDRHDTAGSGEESQKDLMH